ncbi:hypothetical protein [Vulcanisaeta sp. JCM 16159]|uniref:hypothetical protein n=1 Tax=Vulcanisaeta sp. JCM 16159 TaxID=1295371 RepID=UPI0006D13ACE|nr:hypothetical protein [Vulcanisaeta sp. JCM 16159]
MVSKDVIFDEVRRVGREWVIRGRVRSRSRPSIWHGVEVRIRRLRSGEVAIVGRCDCEAFTKGHMVCWHILHLANVFIRNRRKLINGLGVTVN